MRKTHLWLLIALLVVCSSCIGSQDKNNYVSNADAEPTLPIDPTTTEVTMSPVLPTPIIPTLIPSLEIPPTYDSFFSTHVLVVKEFETGNVIAYDLISGNSRQLNSDSDTYFSEIYWEGSGCEILVSSRFNGVLGINLDGTIVERFPSLEFNNFSVAISPSLSSDKQYLAYLVQVFHNNFDAKGGYEMTLTVNDLYIHNLAYPEDFLILSDNNSVTEYEWSNVDRLIAYSDLDSRGVHQLFVSDPIGEQKRKLSSFTEEFSLIKHIAWAPENNTIAFVYTIMEDEYIEEDLRHLDQLYISDYLGEPKLLEIQTEFKIINNILYLDNENIVVFGEEKYGQSKIIILNITSMEEKSLFPNEEILNFSYPIQYYPDGGIGFFIFGKEKIFVTYNITTEIIRYYPTDLQGFQSFFGPPEQYSGEDRCSSN